MSFFAPVNSRTETSVVARGISSVTKSPAEAVAIFVAIFIVGFAVALVVTMMHFLVEVIGEKRLEFIYSISDSRDLPPSTRVLCAWLAHLGFGLAFGSVALLCSLLVPTSKGSGLPQLIAYLNGCKLPRFTSFRTLLAKAAGTVCASNRPNSTDVAAAFCSMYTAGLWSVEHADFSPKVWSFVSVGMR